MQLPPNQKKAAALRAQSAAADSSLDLDKAMDGTKERTGTSPSAREDGAAKEAAPSAAPAVSFKKPSFKKPAFKKRGAPNGASKGAWVFDTSMILVHNSRQSSMQQRIESERAGDADQLALRHARQHPCLAVRAKPCCRDHPLQFSLFSISRRASLGACRSLLSSAVGRRRS